MTTSKFADLGLSDSILRALSDTNYHTATPIQTGAIPPLLQGRDLLGIAQTGTGKTAAFVLPLIQTLTKDRRHPTPRSARALILSPTRELATQISESIATYGRHSGLRHAVIMGGVSQNKQVKTMERGVDILIATPGRLLDLVNQRRVDLGRTAHLVLDEADRLLDMGFIRDVRKLAAMLPGQRQSALFSATMPQEVVKLANEILNDPVRVEIAAKSVAVDRIDQRVYHVDQKAKNKLLADLLQDPALSRVIVFTRTKRGADRVARQLGAGGVDAAAIHGDKTQGAREKALESFRRGKSRVLVATDIVARGIDVDDVTHVINYELPREAESYVHRIGRTARAGAEGSAVSFCNPEEQAQLRVIEKLIKRRLTVVGDDPTAGIDGSSNVAQFPRSRSGKSSGPAGKPRQKRRSRRRNRRQAA